MQVLVVYAHPNPGSFSHALLESFTDGLKEGGHSFEIVDLYAIDFDPRMRLEDFAQFAGGEMPEDVLEQQEKIARADALAFIYPIWTMGQPAILKGWIDRVFSAGFAHELDEKTGDVTGLLTHRKVLFINATGAGKEVYQSTGAEEAIKKIDRVNFEVAYGIRNVEHLFLYSALTDAEARSDYLNLVYRLGQEF